MSKVLFRLILVVFLFGINNAHALDSKDGAPVLVKASPEVVLTGKPVALTGNTTTDGTRVDVQLAITLPDGSKVERTAPANAKGDFRLDFTQTDKAGSYTVLATAPDGKATAEAKFTVTGPTGVGQMASDAFEELAKTAEENIKDSKALLQGLPASAEREELLAKAGELENQAGEIRQKAAQLTAEIDKMMKVLEEPTPVELEPESAATVAELAAWAREARVEALKQALPKEPHDPSLCDTIHTAAEGLRLASTLFNFIATGKAALINLTIDKGIPALLNLKFPERHPFWDQPAKAAATTAQSMDAFLGSAPGMAIDMTTMLVDGLLNLYCGRYAGPIKATMSGTFKHLGKKYWTYSLTIEGRFELRFPKKSPAGQPVVLTGEIFGNATDYTFWEDVEKIMEVPAGGRIMVRRPITPGPFPALYKDPLGLGQIVNLALPPVFFIPMEGRMEGDLVVLDLKEPVKDIADFLLKNQLIMVYMAHGLPVHAVKHFEFPMQGAHFILTRGMRTPADITITKSGKASFLKKKFTRVWESDDKQIEVRWEVDLNAGNPPVK